MERHCKGTSASVLLTSVFGPYAATTSSAAAASTHGVYHNQVTREQGAFRCACSTALGHHDDPGEHLRPCACSTSPLVSLRAGTSGHAYDVVGISGIIVTSAR